MHYPDKTCLIHDYGLFAELAPRLARDFGRVLYYMPWKSSFPRSTYLMVGKGLEGVQRVSNFWDVADEVDLFVFPDIYDADLQRHLRSLGKRVWGNFGAEMMEMDRWGMRKLQKRLGLPYPKTSRIIGLSSLKNYLHDKQNKWVKISTFRGDLETFHHENWFTTEPLLDKLESSLGKLKDVYEFIAEDSIPGIEIGYDGWSIDGRFPSIAAFGYEIKDQGYVGKVLPYEELPEQVREVNQAIEQVLRSVGARGFFSSEIRIGPDQKPYLIDPCMRSGSPPTEVLMELYDNLAEIIYEGAVGNMVMPQPAGSYMAIAMIHSQWALTNWVPIDFPETDRRWIKLRNLTRIDGRSYYVPLGLSMPEIGAVTAIGETMDEAIRLVQERAEHVKGYQVEIKTKDLKSAYEEVAEGHQLGIKF